MVAVRTPLIAGNWKLNFDHLQATAFVQKLAWTLKDAKHDFDEVEVAVFPPFTDLRSVQTIVEADKLRVAYGAQDVSQHESGAHTGEVAASMLKALKCDYALVGHSERRADHGETDAVCNAKIARAVAAGLAPVLCVGETMEEREAHGPSATPVAQLRAALEDQPSLKGLVVAYEPVWAIGSGSAATPEQAEEVCGALRAELRALLGNAAADDTRILYGGSVKPSNIASFMREVDVDGALVGGASLSVEDFSAIARFKKHVTA